MKKFLVILFAFFICSPSFALSKKEVQSFFKTSNVTQFPTIYLSSLTSKINKNWTRYTSKVPIKFGPEALTMVGKSFQLLIPYNSIAFIMTERKKFMTIVLK